MSHNVPQMSTGGLWAGRGHRDCAEASDLDDVALVKVDGDARYSKAVGLSENSSDETRLDDLSLGG